VWIACQQRCFPVLATATAAVADQPHHVAGIVGQRQRPAICDVVRWFTGITIASPVLWPNAPEVQVRIGCSVPPSWASTKLRAPSVRVSPATVARLTTSRAISTETSCQAPSARRAMTRRGSDSSPVRMSSTTVSQSPRAGSVSTKALPSRPCHLAFLHRTQRLRRVESWSVPP